MSGSVDMSDLNNELDNFGHTKLQDDFYAFVNGYWKETHNIPKEYSRWGTFEILNHNNDLKLRHLFESLEDEVEHDKINIKNFYMKLDI